MDKFSYAIGLGIGQNLLSMGAKGIAVDDFAQAIKDVLEGNQTAISHTEATHVGGRGEMGTMRPPTGAALYYLT